MTVSTAEEADFHIGTQDTPSPISHQRSDIDLHESDSDTGMGSTSGRGLSGGGSGSKEVTFSGSPEGKSGSSAKQLRRQMEELFFLRSPGMLVWVTQIMFVENSLSMVLSVFYLVRAAWGG